MPVSGNEIVGKTAQTMISEIEQMPLQPAVAFWSGHKAQTVYRNCCFCKLPVRMPEKRKDSRYTDDQSRSTFSPVGFRPESPYCTH